MSFKNLENPKKKVYCHTCERDISRHTYFFCEDCGDIELCVICYANGKETAKHRRTHRYRIFARLDFIVLEEGWTAIDELLLLEGLETYGYGNWEDIKNHTGGKSKEEVERHFHESYLNQSSRPRIGENLFTRFYSETRHPQISTKTLKNLSQDPRTHREQFKTLLEQRLESLQPVIKQAEEVAQRHGISPNDKNSIYGEILGYMPLREEFDVEYDNDAELFLADMEFGPEDTEEETKMKYCILEIYHRRLREREKRKKFVIERGLLNLKEQFAREKVMSEEEREIRNFLKPFMRFQSKDEHEELVACLLKDLEIKKSIEQLLAAQNVGCETLADLENLVFSNENTFKLERKLLDFNDKRQRQKGGQGGDRRSARTLGPSGAEVKDIGPLGGDMLLKNDDSDHNLCLGEIELCNKLRLGFNDYLLIKEYLVRECMARGFVDRKETIRNVNIDAREFNLIFDFLVQNSLVLPRGE